MNVIRIGERTGGKYTGMQIIPAVIYVDGVPYLDPVIGNWAVNPIVLEYKNKNGENPKGGLAPHYEVSSFYLPLEPLGSENDPLIAQALQLITGSRSVKAQVSNQLNAMRPFRHASSPLDPVKKNFFVK